MAFERLLSHPLSGRQPQRAMGCSATALRAALPFDDGLESSLLPGGGAMVGALLTGSLASLPHLAGDYFPLSAKILEESGHFGLFIARIDTFILPYGFVALGTAIMLSILGALMPLRVSIEEEERGLDFVSHGEESYDPMTN
jgi:Amt family ammonium transporter